MKSVKKTKKTLVTIVTLSVMTAILMTAAAAEEIGLSGTVPPADSGTVSVITSTEILVGQPQSLPSADASVDIAVTPSVTAVSEQEQALTPAPAVPDAGTAADSTTQTPTPDQETFVNQLLLAGQTIVDFTKQYDGFRYVYGSASPKSGFDCSGLVYYVYSHFGFSMPRTARAQFKNGVTVDKAELQPGDLVFFATNGGRSISHVGIYIGDNQFIHAATSRHGVMVSNLGDSYWSRVLVGAKRLITPQTAIDLVTQSVSLSVNLL